MGEPAILTKGLSRKFGSTYALRGLDLSVPCGVVHGLVGPNGAGKTTTLRLLLGLLRPSAGHIQVLSYDPVTRGQEVRCRTGTVLEPCGLYEQLSARANLEYFGQIWHMSRQDRQARSRELLELVGLWERRDELIVDWGRGLRQRLAIARSLMHRPALLLLDDPDVELNSGSADGNPDFLRNLVSQTGLTILLATNIFSISESMCQCLTVLNRGRVIAQGRTEHVSCLGAVPTIVIDGHGFSDAVCELLLRRPEVSAVRHINNGIAVQLVARVDTAPLISLLIESGVSVAEVRKVEPTLQSAVESLLLRDTELESISPEKSP